MENPPAALKKSFLKAWITGIILGLTTTTTLVIAATVSLSDLFSPGEVLSAAKLNSSVDAFKACPPNMVKSGTICVDKYESSVWQIASTNTALIEHIRKGTVTLDELQTTGSTQQVGLSNGDIEANTIYGCLQTGSGCTNIYSVSVPGVLPSRFITWFQAGAACRNASKRLPTNAEWQVAALGTPDGTECVISNTAPQVIGNRPNCVSDIGAFDMVGNVWEMTADWVQGNNVPWDTTLRYTTGEYGQDVIGGNNLNSVDQNLQSKNQSFNGFPSVVLRGGSFTTTGSGSGVYSYNSEIGPDQTDSQSLGFRCVM